MTKGSADDLSSCPFVFFVVNWCANPVYAAAEKR